MIRGIINNATAVAKRQVMVVMGLVVDQEPWRSTEQRKHNNWHTTCQSFSLKAQMTVATIGSS